MYNGVLTDCTITDNVASNTAYGTGCGGGFATGVISNSLVASNLALGRGTDGKVSVGIGTGGGINGSSTLAVNCIISNNYSESRGGGIHLATGYNNLVVDNANGSNGGGVCGGSHYNTLILRNTSTATGGGAGYQTTLVNCTVMENTAPARAGVQECYLINTITWDNTGGADIVNWATNSCGLALTAAMGPGNTTKNPRIATSGDYRYIPAPGSPALNSGMAFSWMTDPGDVRARDRNGRRRVIGTEVDMGALEAPIFGSMMIVR